MNTAEQIKRYTTLWRETLLLYENWAQRHGLSYCELLVILSLAEGNVPCKQKEICRQWQLPKQTVNSILKGFIKRGWVTLAPLEEDRRNKEIRLTQTGKKSISSIEASLLACEKSVWKGLGKERTTSLINNTQRYNQLFREVVTGAVI